MNRGIARSVVSTVPNRDGIRLVASSMAGMKKSSPMSIRMYPLDSLGVRYILPTPRNPKMPKTMARMSASLWLLAPFSLGPALSSLGWGAGSTGIFLKHLGQVMELVGTSSPQ